MREAEAARLVDRIQNAFPGQQMPEGTVKLFIEVLSKHPYQASQQAVERVISAKPWLPTISELEGAIRDVDRPKSKVGDGIHQVARLRGVSYEEARSATVAQLRENDRDDPEGPWKHHLEALGEEVS